MLFIRCFINIFQKKVFSKTNDLKITGAAEVCRGELPYVSGNFIGYLLVFWESM